MSVLQRAGFLNPAFLFSRLFEVPLTPGLMVEQIAVAAITR